MYPTSTNRAFRTSPTRTLETKKHPLPDHPAAPSTPLSLHLPQSCERCVCYSLLFRVRRGPPSSSQGPLKRKNSQTLTLDKEWNPGCIRLRGVDGRNRFRRAPTTDISFPRQPLALLEVAPTRLFDFTKTLKHSVKRIHLIYLDDPNTETFLPITRQ